MPRPSRACYVNLVLQRLTDELDEKEEELRRLRSKVRELEDALSQSRMAAHTADVERNEVGGEGREVGGSAIV